FSPPSSSFLSSSLPSGISSSDVSLLAGTDSWASTRIPLLPQSLVGVLVRLCILRTNPPILTDELSKSVALLISMLQFGLSLLLNVHTHKGETVKLSLTCYYLLLL